jgi:hypothetical protein
MKLISIAIMINSCFYGLLACEKEKDPEESTDGTNETGAEQAEELCLSRTFDFNPSSTASSDSLNSYWLAVFSSLSYLSKTEIKSNIDDKIAYDSLDLISSSFIEDGKTVDSQALWIEVNDENVETSFAVLAFRGTEMKFLDWLTDANHSESDFYGSDSSGEDDSTSYGTVHSGFESALDAIWPDIISKAASFEGPIWVTGHSLGGAMSALAAVKLLTGVEGIDLGGIINFGSPRVGLADFSSSFENLLSSNGATFWRYVNYNDVVPAVPPSIESWVHAIDENVTWFDNDGTEESGASASGRGIEGEDAITATAKSLSDHSVLKYAKRTEEVHYGSSNSCD